MSIDFGNDIYEEPIVAKTFLAEDAQESSLRPKTLTEYIGGTKSSKAKKLLRRYQKAGLNAEIHIYKDARHELHNEKCRDEYFRDLVGFFDSAVKAAEPAKA